LKAVRKPTFRVKVVGPQLHHRLVGDETDHPLVSGRQTTGRDPALVAETHDNSALLGAIDSDSIARRHLLVGTAFLVLAGFLTLLQILKGVFPGILDGLGFWSYGRLRQMASAITVFGWLTPTLIGVAYYLTPRLSGAPIRLTRFAGFNLPFLAAVVVAGTAAVGMGNGDGFEFFPFPLWADLLLLIALAVPAVVVSASLRDRSESAPSAPLLYLSGAVIWLPAIAAVSNLPGQDPVASSLVSSFTTSAIHYLWVGAAAIGIVLYLIPKLTGGALHSEQMARIGFWTLALAGGAAGYTRFTHGPAPDWLETVAIVLGLLLIIVAITTFFNATGSARGHWETIQSSIPLRFALTGALLLPVPIVLSSVAGFRSVAAIVSLTSWWDGTSFFLLFGIGGWTTAAFVYAVLPGLLGRDLYDRNLARRHLRLSLLGVTSTSIFLWLTGMVSGFTWAGGSYSGAYQNTGEGFFQTLTAVSPLWIFTLIGALITFAGQLVHVYLVYRTITSGSPTTSEVLVSVEVADE
jgi:cytochrome c oxidase cbb3-type subunit 1